MTSQQLCAYLTQDRITAIVARLDPTAKLANFTGPTPVMEIPGTFGGSCHSDFSVVARSGGFPRGTASISGLVSQTSMGSAHGNLVQRDAVHLPNGNAFRRELQQDIPTSFVDMLRDGEYYVVNSNIAATDADTLAQFGAFPIEEARDFLTE